MECTGCEKKACRRAESCGRELFSQTEVLNQYRREDKQRTVQASAELVDGGKAGTLSRFQEVLEFIRGMKYRRIGIAYCYALEPLIEDMKGVLEDRLKDSLEKISAVSCTVGGLPQEQINEQSTLPGVSCNPLGQARQLDAEGTEFVIVLGLCLGHDVLFHREIQADCTTLLVKDRVYNHNPLAGIYALLETDKDGN